MTQVPSGVPPQGAAAPRAQPPVASALAILSLILGIISLATAACTLGLAGPLSVVFGGLGLVFGLIAVCRVRRSAGRLTGQGMAVGGIVTSSVGLLLGLIVSVLILLAVLLGHRTERPLRWLRHMEIPAATVPQLAAQSMIGLRQLADAAKAYAEEHEGRLPEASAYPQALQPYIERDRGGLVVPQGRRFAMNRGVAGMRLEDIRDPARTVLFFETRPAGPRIGGQELLRPLSGADDAYVIAFADGHVEWVAREGIADLVWFPAGDLTMLRYPAPLDRIAV